MKKLVLFVALLCVSFASFAWNDHDQLSYYALAGQAYAGMSVSAEELTAFLEAEKAGLAETLRQFESRAARNLPGYPPLPKALYFDPSLSGKPLLDSFVGAIRVNPDRPFLLFVQPAAGKPRDPSRAALSVAEVDMFEAKFPNQPFERLKPGDKATILEVLTTASDEPDYGMDIGLYADNKTAAGSRYGLGVQPFGNPALDYGSQAPFHMSFPWEDPIIKLAASWVKDGLTGYRVSLYTELSRYALASGHDYWAYRFAGWALHYLEDMAQPYHARLMPGKGTFGLLALNVFGSKADKDAAVVLLSNRHLVLEEYMYRVLTAGASDAGGKSLIGALASGTGGSATTAFREGYAYDVIARKAYKRGPALDTLLKMAYPERYVDDPSYDYGADPDYQAYDAKAALESAPARVAGAMARTSEEIFTDIGMYARAYVDYIRSPAGTALPAAKRPPEMRGALYLLALAAVVAGIVFLALRSRRKRKGAGA